MSFLALALLLAQKPVRLDRLTVTTPDIIMFVLDDVGYLDMVGPATPNIDGLAASGFSFLRCYSNPTCAPSRMSLNTGHWWTTNTGPACSAPDSFTPKLSERFIPERLTGYSSALFGKWHLGGSQITQWSHERAPQSQGFPYWLAGTSANLNACGGNDYTHWNRIEDIGGVVTNASETAYEGNVLRDEFVTLYPFAPSPKFTLVNLSLAHAPFQSPPGYSPLLPTAAKFDAMIEYADATIGSMLAVVNLATTTVIVVGDNGTPPQIGGAKSKETCYERGVRVPLIVAGAGVTATGTSSELVHLVDLYATAIELGGGTVGTTPPKPYPNDSVSLVPLLTGATWTPRDHVICGDLWAIPGVEGTRCIVSGDGWKLIQWDTNGDLTVDREELYDLGSDPSESTDVLASNAIKAASLRTTLGAEALP